MNNIRLFHVLTLTLLGFIQTASSQTKVSCISKQPIFTKASDMSTIIDSAYANEIYPVLYEGNSWIQISYVDETKEKKTGWIQKNDLCTTTTIQNKSNESVPNQVITNTSQNNQQSDSFLKGISTVFGAGFSLDVSKYGANQGTIHIDLEKEFIPKIELIDRFRASLLGGKFSTYAVDIGAQYVLIKKNNLSIKPGILLGYEYLRGNSKSAHGLNFTPKVSVRYDFPKYFVSVEPLALDFMLIHTKKLPFNVRNFFFISVGKTW